MSCQLRCHRFKSALGSTVTISRFAGVECRPGQMTEMNAIKTRKASRSKSVRSNLFASDLKKYVKNFHPIISLTIWIPCSFIFSSELTS